MILQLVQATGATAPSANHNVCVALLVMRFRSNFTLSALTHELLVLEATSLLVFLQEAEHSLCTCIQCI